MTPAILFKFTLAALLAIWPAAVDSKFYPGPKVDRPSFPITQDTPDADVMAYCYGNPPGERRVCRIAREVSAVVHEHTAEDRIPFVGPAAEQATALALLEIAWHESGYRSKVETCLINGDPPRKGAPLSEGLAISLFQLQANNHFDLFVMGGFVAGTRTPRPKRYDRETICQSNALAARLALHALMRQAWVTRGSTHPKTVEGMFFTYASGKSRSTKVGREHVAQFEAMARRDGITLASAGGEIRATVGLAPTVQK